MKYSNIIDDMRWSYSRITTYENCPYSFFLIYILNVEKKRKFFDSYGSFVHSIIQKYLTGELSKSSLANYYISHFKENIVGEAPSRKVRSTYFQQGLSYFLNIRSPNGRIRGVEEEVSFNIEEKKFIGYIDAVIESDDSINIIDNKSRILKPRSNRKMPTKSDKELDKYLRQLYLYSIPVKERFGKLPSNLIFNCFRDQSYIAELFNVDSFESVKSWALKTIESITNESKWDPNIDWFKCKYLCSCSYCCEYFQMYGGEGAFGK